MHVIRPFTAVMMAVSMLLVSSLPAVSAAVCDISGASAGMNDMIMAEIGMDMQIAPVAPLIDLADCYIECGCRIDNHVDGMPHQLAPHAFSIRSYDIAPAMNYAIAMAEPVFTSRLLPFPTPPPRTI